MLLLHAFSFECKLQPDLVLYINYCFSQKANKTNYKSYVNTLNVNQIEKQPGILEKSKSRSVRMSKTLAKQEERMRCISVDCFHSLVFQLGFCNAKILLSA